MWDWKIETEDGKIVIINDCQFSEIYIYADSDCGISEDEIIKVERL